MLKAFFFSSYLSACSLESAGLRAIFVTVARNTKNTGFLAGEMLKNDGIKGAIYIYWAITIKKGKYGDHVFTLS